MTISCTPALWNTIHLFGSHDQQREAARKYCLLAHTKGVRWVTLQQDDGSASISGRPVDVMRSLTR